MSGLVGFDLSDLVGLIPARTALGERKWHKWRVWYEPPMDCMDCGRSFDEPGAWSASNGLRFKSFPTCAEAWAWIESGPSPAEPWTAPTWSTLAGAPE